ncbi:MAG: sulfite reductase flavoprotein subunit alpha, partial [Pseudomonadota bacterium]
MKDANTKVPFIPEGAPFNEDQKAWISGFLAGLHSRAAIDASQAAAVGEAPAQAAAPKLDILYGTQTGNAEMVANDAADVARTQGFAPVVQGLDEVSMEQLGQMKLILVAISTYGEGEMPDNAELFWDELKGPNAPRMEHAKFGIVALGDTSYDEFCHAGKLLDTRFEQLGAERLLARVDCDVDFEDLVENWVCDFVPLLIEHADTAYAGSNETVTAASPAPKKSKWNRKNPYESRAIENSLLSGGKSAKEIRHFSFALEDEDMDYAAGDALGVIPVNDADLVTQMIEFVGAKPDQSTGSTDKSLADMLTSELEICTPPKQFVEHVASLNSDDELANIIANGDKEALEAFMWGRDTLDLLEMAGKGAISADELVSFLKPLQHRAYSISSSPKAHEGE